MQSYGFGSQFSPDLQPGKEDNNYLQKYKNFNMDPKHCLKDYGIIN